MLKSIYLLFLVIGFQSAWAQQYDTQELECRTTSQTQTVSLAYKLSCQKNLTIFQGCSLEISDWTNTDPIIKNLDLEIVQQTNDIISLLNPLEQIKVEVTNTPLMTATIELADGTALICGGSSGGGGTSIGN